MFTLAFNLASNYLLLGRVLDGLVEIGACLIDVFNASRAQRLKERKDLFAVFNTQRRVNKGDLTAVGVVSVQDGVLGPAVVDSRDLVHNVMCVCNARVEAETTSGRERMGSIADAVIRVKITVRRKG